MIKISGGRDLGFRCQISGVTAVTTKSYIDVEDRGQNLEVGGKTTEGRGLNCETGNPPAGWESVGQFGNYSIAICTS